MAHRLAGAALSACALAPQLCAQSLEWTRNPFNARWYSELPVPLSWNDSADFARRSGGELATVRTPAEQAWLTQRYFQHAPRWGFHWIGLFQDPLDPGFAEPAGGWRWIGGEPLTHLEWAPGSPDNAAPDESFARTLGALSSTSPGLWSDSQERSLETPSGLLDWCIGPGQFVLFDTAHSTVTLGQLTVHVANPSFPNDPLNPPNTLFAPTTQRVFEGGVVEVRSFFLHEGSVLRIEGPNAFHLLASGDVWIRGRVIADGGQAPELLLLQGTFRGPADFVPGVPPPPFVPTGVLAGGVGRAGGGNGGDVSIGGPANPDSGEPGEGAFGMAGLGGGGGETGWNASPPVESFRGAGGGGGRLGHDASHPQPPSTGHADQRRIGLDAEHGFDNFSGQNGALSGPGNPAGGAAGPTPFVSANLADDFFGVAEDSVRAAFVLGELERPWAGAGGGAGGFAYFSTSWPSAPTPYGYAGGAGGGGAGSVRVTALGAVRLGAQGSIQARGGGGAGGANSSFLNRVGGAGGGGSGGHVILETSAEIDLRACALVVLENRNDVRFAIDARGGQGGPGRGNLGGTQYSANGYVSTWPHLDACPPGYPSSGDNACRGHVDGAGGDGGPGIVQLHTPLGSAGSTPGAHDILLPAGGELARVISPPPFGGAFQLLTSAGGGRGVVEMASEDCDGDFTPDRYTIAVDPSRDLDGDGTLDDCEAIVPYCQSGKSTLGCFPSLDGAGTPSASASSGFTLTASALDGKRIVALYYGLTRAELPFAAGSTSTLCVAAPLRRAALARSGGTAGSCDGTLALDWNAWRAAHPNALGAPFSAGVVLFAQAWLRDGAAPGGATLTDGVRFLLAP